MHISFSSGLRLVWTTNQYWYLKRKQRNFQRRCNDASLIVVVGQHKEEPDVDRDHQDDQVDELGLDVLAEVDGAVGDDEEEHGEEEEEEAERGWCWSWSAGPRRWPLAPPEKTEQEFKGNMEYW